MRFESDIKLDYSDVLIRPKRSTIQSRSEVIVSRKLTFLHSPRTWEGVPICSANMDTTGTFSMAKSLSKYKLLTALHKHYSIEQLENFFKDFNEPNYIAYSLGIREGDFNKLKRILEKGLGDKFNFIVLDVPNAYLVDFLDKVKELRKLCPEHIIIAGNVVTNEMTEELLLNGADIVKIGIGPGSGCTTRKQTGVGYPQLSAIIECADAAHGITGKSGGCGLIMADGGATTPSCLAKSFCAGGDFIMMGGMFAGFEESGGDLIETNGKLYKQYYGMSSATAMKKHYGKVETYRSSEGRYTEIPYKGKIEDFILEILGSLRSTGTYIGARRLKEFSRRATFLMVNRQLNAVFESYSKSEVGMYEKQTNLK